MLKVSWWMDKTESKQKGLATSNSLELINFKDKFDEVYRTLDQIGRLEHSFFLCGGEELWRK